MMAMKDRSWFEEKVRNLADLLRRLPHTRRRIVLDALEEDRNPDGRQDAGGSVDNDRRESGPNVPPPSSTRRRR
jgi:hypothetical protein